MDYDFLFSSQSSIFPIGISITEHTCYKVKHLEWKWLSKFCSYICLTAGGVGPVCVSSFRSKTDVTQDSKLETQKVLIFSLQKYTVVTPLGGAWEGGGRK